ncbi:MAG TPA: M13 family metallopeptidase N-terminal domain-containing protein, partial [Segetibacter sp.]
MKNPLFFLLVLIFILSACTNTETNSQPDFLIKNIDTTVSPADDFFDYAIGNWAKNTPIPEEESAWGIGNMVQEEIYTRLRKINEKAVEKRTTTGIEQKIGNFWYSGMDTLSIEKQGLKPLKADLDNISRIQSVHDVMKVVSDFHKKGINVLFNVYVAQDDKNSEVYAFQM